MEELIKKLNAVMASENIRRNEPMKNYTSFKVGGPVDILLMPQTKQEVAEALSICRDTDISLYIMGNGSNLLVQDGGVRGIILQTKALKHVEIDGETLMAEPGITLKDLADIALEEKLTGLEFASGIPGTLGGAVTMNAGAYDGEMKNIVASIEVIDENGNLKTIPVEACDFGYRTSVMQKYGWLLIGINLNLRKGDYNEIKNKMMDFNARRQEKQPLEYPSAGSTFRRPEGYYAGKLVQDAGFRGYCIGGAQVSEKHSGFVINKGDATAADILELIATIQAGVKEKFGVELATEVIVIGEP
ncbi:MAG: UDP-N-acetylmuramate dehydrogenase [Eubacteriaceae bacterium]|nr:UDP-N-acetylmuramate dehydrogenase [Eubacteriaceae bacterium]